VVERRHGPPAGGNVASHPASRPHMARDNANRGRAPGSPIQEGAAAPKVKRRRRRRKGNAGGTSPGHAAGAREAHFGPTKNVKETHHRATPHPSSPAKR
jgi:hypothetical protein